MYTTRIIVERQTQQYSKGTRGETNVHKTNVVAVIGLFFQVSCVLGRGQGRIDSFDLCTSFTQQEGYRRVNVVT